MNNAGGDLAAEICPRKDTACLGYAQLCSGKRYWITSHPSFTSVKRLIERQRMR